MLSGRLPAQPQLPHGLRAIMRARCRRAAGSRAGPAGLATRVRPLPSPRRISPALAATEMPRRNTGVLANCIAPGAIETSILAGFTPEALAALVTKCPLG